MICFPFIKVIVPQSKAHILRRFRKIGRKVIEYAYVSGQCRQIIFLTGLCFVYILTSALNCVDGVNSLILKEWPKNSAKKKRKKQHCHCQCVTLLSISRALDIPNVTENNSQSLSVK